MAFGAASHAYRILSSPDGPERFAQVTPSLYRGGQPTPSQLLLLHRLGVRTIVTLVDEPAVVRAEIDAAAPLGLVVRSHPFSGLSQPDPAQLRQIVEELRCARVPLYLHCRHGRDRTSVIVALYRVWVHNWDRDLAWRREALDFGHGGLRAIFFRKLDRAYARLTCPGSL